MPFLPVPINGAGPLPDLMTSPSKESGVGRCPWTYWAQRSEEPSMEMDQARRSEEDLPVQAASPCGTCRLSAGQGLRSSRDSASGFPLSDEGGCVAAA